jgi:Zn-finger nucleic acid-binding protein
MVKLIDKDQYHIKYESCPVCYGTFFDAGEFTDLKEKTVVERFKHFIDIVKGNLPHSSV